VPRSQPEAAPPPGSLPRPAGPPRYPAHDQAIAAGQPPSRLEPGRQGLPPIRSMRSSLVTPYDWRTSTAKSRSTGSGRTRRASSASSGNPVRRSMSTTCCLADCIAPAHLSCAIDREFRRCVGADGRRRTRPSQCRAAACQLAAVAGYRVQLRVAPPPLEVAWVRRTAGQPWPGRARGHQAWRPGRAAAGPRSLRRPVRRWHSSGQRHDQGGRVVASPVHHAVDEQGGCAQHLSRGDPAVDVPADTL
jgi:hypothetical protein